MTCYVCFLVGCCRAGVDLRLDVGAVVCHQLVKIPAVEEIRRADCFLDPVIKAATADAKRWPGVVSPIN